MGITQGSEGSASAVFPCSRKPNKFTHSGDFGVLHFTHQVLLKTQEQKHSTLGIKLRGVYWGSFLCCWSGLNYFCYLWKFTFFPHQKDWEQDAWDSLWCFWLRRPWVAQKSNHFAVSFLTAVLNLPRLSLGKTFAYAAPNMLTGHICAKLVPAVKQIWF